MNHTHQWTAANIPDLNGKTAVVTGGNTGIGYEIALQLYKAGAHVVIACRDSSKGQQAVNRMMASAGRGSVTCRHLDLASLQSIQAFATGFENEYPSLDILVNNAGIMYPPATLSPEGFELQFATNFLGHFALTARLFQLIKGRIVTMGSGAYKRVNAIDFDNLRLEKGYDATTAYAVSKLADLQFALELDRRCTLNQTSIAAHPGVTKTELQRHLDPVERDERMAIFGEMMLPAQAALPALYAATAPEAVGGGYYGPDGENEYKGYPAPAFINEVAKDKESAIRLWQLAEEVTGVRLL